MADDVSPREGRGERGWEERGFLKTGRRSAGLRWLLAVGGIVADGRAWRLSRADGLAEVRIVGSGITPFVKSDRYAIAVACCSVRCGTRRLRDGAYSWCEGVHINTLGCVKSGGSARPTSGGSWVDDLLEGVSHGSTTSGDGGLVGGTGEA